MALAEDIEALFQSQHHLTIVEVVPVEDTMSNADGESSKHITDLAYLEFMRQYNCYSRLLSAINKFRKGGWMKSPTMGWIIHSQPSSIM